MASHAALTVVTIRLSSQYEIHPQVLFWSLRERPRLLSGTFALKLGSSPHSTSWKRATSAGNAMCLPAVGDGGCVRRGRRLRFGCWGLRILPFRVGLGTAVGSLLWINVLPR